MMSGGLPAGSDNVKRVGLWFLIVLLVGCCFAPIACSEVAHGQRTLTDRSVDWPTAEQWKRVLWMKDYNTRVVVLGTTLLGLSAGVVGSFTLLRKRALMADALSHATLPGICITFMLVTYWGFNGKSLPLLLMGAAVSGLIGVVTILLIRAQTRLKEDAALGYVLSVFFGAGIALLSVAQRMEHGHAAGLESYIYGKTASMLQSDAWLIGFSGLGSCLLCVLLYKELTLLCFDEAFAGSEGYRIFSLDSLLMSGVVIVTIVGLQAVGLILIIALLVTPAAAARFWTNRLNRMLIISALIGGAGGMVGSALSALFPKLPSGAMIVLTATSLFAISMFFGPARGVMPRWLRKRKLHARIDREHLLRGIYELIETGQAHEMDRTEMARVEFDDLLLLRSWSAQRLRREIRKAESAQILQLSKDGMITVFQKGYRQAAKLTRQHRLWELYLITHAEIAPSQVDRSADMIEHILEPEIIERLERLLAKQRQDDEIVSSPHPL